MNLKTQKHSVVVHRLIIATEVTGKQNKQKSVHTPAELGWKTLSFYWVQFQDNSNLKTLYRGEGTSLMLLLAVLPKLQLKGKAVRRCSKVNIFPIMSQLVNILIWFKSTLQRIELCMNVISSDKHQYSSCRKQFS